MTRQEITENFIVSIEQERIRLQLTQAQMAKQLGISTSGYKKIIGGETTKIDLYTGYKLFELSNKPIFELCGATTPALNALGKLQKLSKAQQQFIDGLIDFELKFKESSDSENDYVTLIEPTGNFEDGMIWDSANFSKINISAYRKKFGSKLTCCIKVASNHLIPVYHAGDIILICQDPPRDGDTGIFIHKESGRAYLRRYRQTNPCRLEPVNNFGQTFYVNSNDPENVDQWIKFGYVLTKLRQD